MQRKNIRNRKKEKKISPLELFVSDEKCFSCQMALSVGYCPICDKFFNFCLKCSMTSCGKFYCPYCNNCCWSGGEKITVYLFSDIGE